MEMFGKIDRTVAGQSELSQATPKFLPQKFRLGKIGTIRTPQSFTFFERYNLH